MLNLQSLSLRRMGRLDINLLILHIQGLILPALLVH